MAVGSYLAQAHKAPKLQLAVGLSLGLSVLFMTTGVDKYWVFFMCWIGGFGVVQSTIYMLCVYQGWLWFEGNRPGLYTGIIIAGSGIGPLIFNPLTTGLINPDVIDSVDGKFPEEVDARFTYMLTVLFICFAVIALIGILGVFQGPMSKLATTEEEDFSMLEMMRTRQFITLWLMSTLSFFLGVFTLNSYKAFGIENGLSEGFLTALGSIGSIFNTGRFVWSALLDRFSYKTVYGSLLVIQTVCGIGIVFFGKIAYLYAPLVCVIILCEGGHMTLIPNIFRVIFGKKAPKVFAVGFSYSGVCALSLFILQGAFLTKDTYNLFFIVFSATSGLAFLILMTCFTDK